jgi:hypothetical protein
LGALGCSATSGGIAQLDNPRANETQSGSCKGEKMRIVLALAVFAASASAIAEIEGMKGEIGDPRLFEFFETALTGL